MNLWIYESKNGQYYFTLETSTNHKVLATSETYWNKSDCIATANLIKREAGAAHVIDMTKAA